METSILSMQRIVNYGSFMQAYALKKTLEKYGHTVSFIDIIQGEILTDINHQMQLNRYTSLLKRDIRQIIGQKRQKDKFKQVYDKFAEEYLELSKEKNYQAGKDLTIIGSDEVFNCTAPSPWGMSTQLFGEHISSEKIISYAGSFGDTTLEKIQQEKLEKKLANALKRQSAISVRDKNSCDIVKALTGIEPEIVLDPTFLYQYDKEIENIEVKEKDYIILYAYPARFLNKKEIKAVKNYAQKRHKKIIAIGFYQYWCDKNLVLTPFEYLAYMKKADYIITDTFHGTIFSIKCNKPFCSFVRESNKNKLGDLLKRLELEDRQVESIEDMETILDTPIDYEKINAIIEAKREKSLQFLEKQIIY